MEESPAENAPVVEKSKPGKTTRKYIRKNLVIVESPAKARTIGKYLGKSYVVKASMGHIRDLPQKRFGIDIEANFEPTYVVLPSKRDTINELKTLAKGANKVYLAPDLDREGEAIAWHLVQALKIPESKVSRVIFNQITKKAIEEAFSHPTTINMNKVNAQQARRILDRIVGYKLSPLLWKKVTKGLSAGRVQSVAMRLIAEREKEIKAFQSQEYWRITAILEDTADPIPFESTLVKVDGKVVDEEPFAVTYEAAANALVDSLKASPFKIVTVTRKEKQDRPDSPFITSTLQQQASIRLKFSSKKTMLIAQQLYEGVDIGPEGSVGLISYMRTDSTNIADEAVAETRDYVQKTYGDKYIPQTRHVYKQSARAQQAHECIRPTSVLRHPDSIREHLSQDQYRLYKMIWDRFVACQMESALLENTTFDIAAGNAEFRTSGKRILFDGYKKVWRTPADDEEQTLPACREGDALTVKELNPTQHFTQPPPRFTEASLIRTLEKEGIGRPSTYATIISTIQDRGYVRSEERKFYATDLGMLVTDKLVKHFQSIVDTQFTSRLEDELDEVEEQKVDWHQILKEFHVVFAKDLEKASVEMESEKTGQEPTGEVCELCTKPMVVRWSRRGKFLGCSGYPDCKNIRPLGTPAGAEAVSPDLAKEVCENCGAQMVMRTGRAGRFLACSAYPKCKTTRAVPGEQKTTPHVEFNCKRCEKPMIVRWSRSGPFYACSGYPDCKYTVSMDREGKPIIMEDVDEKCEKCGSPMALKYSPRRHSKFLACTAFPKCRNTRPYKKGEGAEIEGAGKPAE